MASDELKIQTPSLQLLLLIVCFLGSNLVAFYVGYSWSTAAASIGCSGVQELAHHLVKSSTSSLERLPDSGQLCRNLHSQLNTTQLELSLTRSQLSELREELKATQDLSKHLFGAAGAGDDEAAKVAEDEKWESLYRLKLAEDKSPELREHMKEQKLPLGWSAGMASADMISPIGHGCARTEDNMERLIKYMDYEVGGDCPDDGRDAQALMVKGCEPLPRRRCFARGPGGENYKSPLPYPNCSWQMPPDESIHWAAYTCKSLECLNERKYKKVFEDCIDCFELNGREKDRWAKSGPRDVDLSIDEVLAMGFGHIRIGLDIGGGTGSFAVRMRERNVTIVTTTLNLNGPFNNFVALRGVVPLFLSIAQRLPFFDNTLDIVHSMHVLSNWIPARTLEFILFDIDRVLRPGGLFWLDHFFCIRPQLDEIYLPIISKLGYGRLRWAVAPKLDRGAHLQEVYLTAVLQKPLNPPSRSKS